MPSEELKSQILKLKTTTQISNLMKETNLNKRTYIFALKIIKFVENLPKDSSSQIMGRQLLRSGTSVPANIIEAHSASSKRDFINFYNHSLKSANESKLWIALLRDANKIERKEAETLIQETSEIAKMIASSILTMKGKRFEL